MTRLFRICVLRSAYYFLLNEEHSLIGFVTTVPFSSHGTDGTPPVELASEVNEVNEVIAKATVNRTFNWILSLI